MITIVRGDLKEIVIINERRKIDDLPFLVVHEWLYEEFHSSVRDHVLSHSIVVDSPDFHSILVEVFHEDEIIPKRKIH